MSSNNGNGHKPHHIKNLKKVTKAGLKAAAVISNGSPTKMAKLLNIAPSTAHQHLKKPELNNLVSDARAQALKKAGINRVRVYKKINANLDSVVPQKQTHAIDRSLELLGDLNKDNNNKPTVPILVIVRPGGKPIDIEVTNANTST